MALEGQISVDTEQLRAQSSEVKNQVDAMEKRFEQLKEIVNGTSAYWIGNAGDEHRKQYTNRISKIEEVLARYRERVADLEEMAGIFDSAQKEALASAEGLPKSTV